MSHHLHRRQQVAPEPPLVPPVDAWLKPSTRGVDLLDLDVDALAGALVC